MDVLDYLNRIGAPDPQPPSLEYLAALQLAHLYSIPFENWSVMNKEPIILDEALLYEKIVRRRRGGFCYELNGLFAWLLRELGFAVTQVSARVYSGEPPALGPDFDHMALIVDLGQRYLVDVGFGDSAREPLRLPDGEVADASVRYRLRRTAPGALVLERYREPLWRGLYRFTTRGHSLADFTPMCAYQQTAPDSHFTQRFFCTLATPGGRITLSEESLTFTTGAKKRRVPITTAAEQRRALCEHFGFAATGDGE